MTLGGGITSVSGVEDVGAQAVASDKVSSDNPESPEIRRRIIERTLAYRGSTRWSQVGICCPTSQALHADIDTKVLLGHPVEYALTKLTKQRVISRSRVPSRASPWLEYEQKHRILAHFCSK
ncbi:MAG: hypothetical protein KC457_20875 [Myxococcales bacterium]|nr:hypothetical protein [Myxococcales bacterium]